MDYQSASKGVQAISIVLFLSTLALLAYFARSFLREKLKSPFNVILSLMMISMVISTLFNGLYPNEMVALRSSLDALPINQSNLLIYITATTIFNYLLYCLNISLSYIRSKGIAELRPKWEQRTLKYSVIICIALYVICIACVGVDIMVSMGHFEQVPGSLAGLIYVFVEIYYLVRFVIYIRGASKQGMGNQKLEIIAKYGIIQIAIVVVSLLVECLVFVIPYKLILVFIDVFLLFTSCLTCLVYVIMAMKLRTVKSRTTASKSNTVQKAVAASKAVSDANTSL